jgi:putative endonuclease
LSRALGQRCERRALAFLRARGLESVTNNYRCRGGELDLVMLDADTLVIVEVRSRARGALCSAEASITRTKRQRILHATRHFLAAHPRLASRPVRFDVVAISRAAGENELRWIRDAFRA